MEGHTKLKVARNTGLTKKQQEGQHPLTGQRAPPISGRAGLIGDVGL